MIFLLSVLSAWGDSSPLVQQLFCPPEYRVIPKIPPPRLNRSSSIYQVFSALRKEATFNGTCYLWSCHSEQYTGKQCQWCLPDVMVAGFSKCGTTAFCDKLSGHPEIKRYRKKEVNIFTKLGEFSWETLETRSQDLHPNDPGRSWMDCSSGAFRDLQVVTHLRKYSPQTKVIFMVRDPWQRMGSYIEMIKRNAKSPEDLKVLLDRLRDKIRRHGAQPDSVRLSTQGIKHLAEVNNFMFIENILVWMAALGRENLLVLDHYALEHDPLGTLRRTEKFLGLFSHNYSSELLSSVSSNAVSSDGSPVARSSRGSLTSLSGSPTKSIHPPYSIKDKRIIRLTKRLFVPSLCLFEAVFGWPVRLVTPEIIKDLPTQKDQKGMAGTSEVNVEQGDEEKEEEQKSGRVEDQSEGEGESEEEDDH
jgi:hypothetical protein